MDFFLKSSHNSVYLTLLSISIKVLVTLWETWHINLGVIFRSRLSFSFRSSVGADESVLNSPSNECLLLPLWYSLFISGVGRLWQECCHYMFLDVQFLWQHHIVSGAGVSYLKYTFSHVLSWQHLAPSTSLSFSLISVAQSPPTDTGTRLPKYTGDHPQCPCPHPCLVLYYFFVDVCLWVCEMCLQTSA